MITLVFKSAGGQILDRKRVEGAVGKASLKAFRKVGAFIRQRAKSSIRKRKRISGPGSPPSGHVGNLRRVIKFAADERGVIVGPERLGGTVDPDALPALEYGGPSTAEGRKGRRRRITVKARPFMGPALKQELPGLPAMWRDSVR